MEFLTNELPAFKIAAAYSKIRFAQKLQKGGDILFVLHGKSVGVRFFFLIHAVLLPIQGMIEVAGHVICLIRNSPDGFQCGELIHGEAFLGIALQNACAVGCIDDCF